MKLLQEYIRYVLIEGKIEDLSKKYPHIDVASIAELDPTPTKKLLPWMIKQVEKGSDLEQIGYVCQQFIKDGPRLQNKDINSYSSVEDLRSALDNLGKSGRSKRVEIKGGADQIYEDDNVIVLRINSHEAAKLYGKNTKWCITSNGSEYKKYSNENTLFYYVLRKYQSDDLLDKVALETQRDENNVVTIIAAWNQEDEDMLPEDADISDKVLAVVKSDASLQPMTMGAKFQSDAKDEEFIPYWKKLRTFDEKIELLCSRPWGDDFLLTILPLETDKEIKHIIRGLIDKSIQQYSNSIGFFNHNGKLHRDNDQPAVICADGTKEWYQNGELHRDNDQPAKIYSDGAKEWYQNGEKHRDNDQPATIYADGSKYWYQNGQRHRDNDQPAVIYANGTKIWYQNGKKHRDNDQPAEIDADGSKEWWQNGKFVRSERF